MWRITFFREKAEKEVKDYFMGISIFIDFLVLYYIHAGHKKVTDWHSEFQGNQGKRLRLY